MGLQIILDFDDTLVQTSERLRNCLNAVLPHGLSLDVVEFDHYRENKRIREIYEEVSNKPWAAVESVFRSLVESKEFLRFDSLIIDQAEIGRLSTISNGLILCSIRSDRENLLWQLDYLQILCYFKQIVAVPRTGEGPMKKKALLALRQRHLDLVFIGDSNDDRLSAAQAMVPFISSKTTHWYMKLT